MQQLTVNQLKVASDYYVTKLYKDWIRHGKIIICVDYDQTILPYQSFEKELCQMVVDTIKEAQAIGATVILFTCRDGEMLEKAKEYCKSINLHFDQINPIDPFLPGYSQKPYCNVMLDDKAGLLSALYILQNAITMYKSYIENLLPIFKTYETDNK